MEAAVLRETLLVSIADEELRMVWVEHSQVTRPAGWPFPQNYVESVSFTKEFSSLNFLDFRTRMRRTE